jgi:hypothetical protein
METELYLEQRAHWPKEGRAILAHYDDDAIVVYQAFRPQIADEAVQLGRFGPSFSRSRMSWIKPNFLWLPRVFFERVLAAAVASTFDATAWRDENAWKGAVANSDVRLQWDPDHGPSGTPQTRKAVQLGLRGAMLKEYADRAILRVEDVTALVAAQREHAKSPFTNLQTPRERVYVPSDPAAIRALGL